MPKVRQFSTRFISLIAWFWMNELFRYGGKTCYSKSLDMCDFHRDCIDGDDENNHICGEFDHWHWGLLIIWVRVRWAEQPGQSVHVRLLTRQLQLDSQRGADEVDPGPGHRPRGHVLHEARHVPVLQQWPRHHRTAEVLSIWLSHL